MPCVLVTQQVHVTDIENPEEASFFESVEAAHSMHDLASLIAKVQFSPFFTSVMSHEYSSNFKNLTKETRCESTTCSNR